MTEFYAFATNNPWLTAWLVLLAYWLLTFITAVPFKMYNRTLRMINIRNRGWPTQANMDADGDIIHPKKD